MSTPNSSRVAFKHLTGGTTWRTLNGYGWTVQEAWEDALQRDEESYGRGYGGRSNMREDDEGGKTVQVRKPKKPGKVKVQKSQVRKGPVNKVFEIRTVWQTESNGPLSRDRRYQKQYTTQGEVLKAAKALALEYSVELIIELKAYCVGNTTLARITPERGESGHWRFEDVAFRD